MGAGFHGGFGKTKGYLNAQKMLDANKTKKKVNFPPNESQTKHIFRNEKGHLLDTHNNRRILLNLANDETFYLGNDKYGNSWNAKENPDGTQTWVKYRNGVIQNGGINKAPKKWNDKTGLNSSTKKKGGK